MHISIKALAVGVVASIIAAPAAAQPGAKTFVEGLYAAYRNHDSPSNTGSTAPRVYSPGLVALIRADQKQAGGEVGKLDGDPLCDCQDPEGLKLLSVKIAPISAVKAKATSVFRLGGEVRTVGLRLVHTPRGWRVDDVSSPDTKSLRRLLAN